MLHPWSFIKGWKCLYWHNKYWPWAGAKTLALWYRALDSGLELGQCPHWTGLYYMISSLGTFRAHACNYDPHTYKTCVKTSNLDWVCTHVPKNEFFIGWFKIPGWTFHVKPLGQTLCLCFLSIHLASPQKGYFLKKNGLDRPFKATWVRVLACAKLQWERINCTLVYLFSVWRIICENLNPNGLIFAEIWMKI